MNKRITSYAACLYLLVGTCLCAQTPIRGRVVDQERKGIPYATVTIRYRGKVEQRMQTDEDGRYRYSTKQNTKKDYRADFSHLAYETRTLELDLSKEEQQTVVLRPRSNELDEYVVTATRSRHHLEELPLPVKVVDAVDIKRIAPQNTKDIMLYSLPGVEFSSHGGITHVKIQGLSADYYAFLIDGEEIAGMKSGSPDFLRLSPENIERVEIIRGAGSALYGSGAIGGVVNIVTKQAKSPLSLSLCGGYSMPKVWDGFGDLSINRKRWSNNTSFSIGKEGDYPINRRDGKSYIWVPRNDVYRLSDRFKWKAGDRLTIKADVGGMSRKQARTEYQNDIYNSLNGRLTGAYDFDDQNSLALSYNADFSSRDRRYPKDPGKHDLIHSNFKHILRAHYNRTFADKSSLATGLEGRQELLISDQIAGGASQKSILNGVLYGQYMRELGGGFEMMAGLRADVHGRYGLNLSPKLTFAYTWKDLSLRAGYARAFKSPSLMELYYDWSHQGMFHIYGNPDLKPEIANQLMLGTNYRSSRLMLSGGVTYTVFKDQIAMQTDAKQDQRHVNIAGTSTMLNADVTAEWFVVNGLSLKGMYSYSRAPKVVEHLGKKYDVNNVRPHNLMLQLNGFWHCRDWAFTGSLIGQYLSRVEYYSLDVNDEGELDETKPLVHERVEGYPLVRLTTTAEYKGRYTLTLGANNLLNFKPANLTYQTGTLSPGAVFFTRIGIRLF